MSTITDLALSESFDIEGNLLLQRGLIRSRKFEELYLQLRKREDRLYSDSELAALPAIHKMHAHYREWLVRAHSMSKLLAYLSKRKAPRHILEVGCGNGWLSHHLAARLPAEVCALDINEHELRQGSRVFAARKNLVFLYADVLDWPATQVQFDTIVMASSVQYFSDIHAVIPRLLERLADHGELHILDSSFYADENVRAAQERSRTYFESLGLPEMTGTYYHHRAEELRPYTPDVLYDPRGIRSVIERKLFRKPASPFPWYRITKRYQPIDFQP